ncbi:uncharacterized protein LOC126204326 [Schistocerca nitens]|uniref:uncharacterized protein LOC126204326 n=1 Tax=Schistocerca nitens TaxID=7011 RepID=UPI00211745E3|nr:uncharacterized protein LOC126204326 [Schistocerca nitens]
MSNIKRSVRVTTRAGSRPRIERSQSQAPPKVSRKVTIKTDTSRLREKGSLEKETTKEKEKGDRMSLQSRTRGKQQKEREKFPSTRDQDKPQDPSESSSENDPDEPERLGAPEEEETGCSRETCRRLSLNDQRDQEDKQVIPTIGEHQEKEAPISPAAQDGTGQEERERRKGNSPIDDERGSKRMKSSRTRLGPQTHGPGGVSSEDLTGEFQKGGTRHFTAKLSSIQDSDEPSTSSGIRRKVTKTNKEGKTVKPLVIRGQEEPPVCSYYPTRCPKGFPCPHSHNYSLFTPEHMASAIDRMEGAIYTALTRITSLTREVKSLRKKTEKQN